MHTHSHTHEDEHNSYPHGVLFVVGTPIGNLEDITFRAVGTLSSVDLVLCEDTRETAKILEKYGIGTPTLSYHAHTTPAKVKKIVELLSGGKRLALVSDAGTPAISDPGSILIREIRRLSPETQIVSIPGPSALISALSISGVSTHEFVFLGFFPHKKGRETLFKEISSSERTVVFYESPHRIIKTLGSLALHAPEKKVTIAREMTKLFEQVIWGTASELLDYFNINPDKVRGEFVVIVSSN